MKKSVLDYSHQDNSHFLKLIKYVGYTWKSLKTTKMVGFSSLFTSESKSISGLLRSLGGGFFHPCSPSVYFPTKTLAKYMRQSPFGPGFEYVLE